MADSLAEGGGAPAELPVAHSLNWKQRTKRWILLVLALLPLLHVVLLINRYGVNVPYADDFTLAPLLTKVHQHALTFSDLFEQHNEHRYFVTKLLFIAISFAAKGNLRVEMFFSVVLTALTSLNLWFLLRKTTPFSIEQRLLLLFLFNILLFSPVQAENWIWGFQFPLFFNNYLVTCGILVAFCPMSLGRKFVIGVLLAFVATFSFGGGVLLWAVTFPAALLAERMMAWKRKMWWLAGWFAFALGCMALYFFHYVKPPHHPPIGASATPIELYEYVASFLGAHLARATGPEDLTLPVAVGTALLALYFGSILYGKRWARDRSVANRMFPWVALGGYALLSAVLAAAARIGFGINQALDSRYTSFSLYLSIVIIALFAIARDDLHGRNLRPGFSIAFVRLETVLLTVFAFLSFASFSWGRASIVESETTRLRGKGALLFTNVLDVGGIHARYLIGNAADARTFANLLDSIGLLQPPMIRSAEIRNLKTRQTQAGFLDRIDVEGKKCSATGWAIIPTTKKPAYCVVFSYAEPAKGDIAFALSDDIYGRGDVADALKSPGAVWSGWTAHFNRSAVPPGEHLISAWALDTTTGILYPLRTPKLIN